MASTTAEVRRVDVLARSKPIPPGFLEDRRSVYWIDRRPPPLGSSQPMLTARQEELCRARHPHPRWQGDKLSPIWPVSQAAMSTVPSDRLLNLAEPRFVNRGYKYERSAYTMVKDAAKRAEASDRLVQLSVPKPHKVWANSRDTIDFGEFSEPLAPVSSSAKVAKCSGRVESLAEAKTEPSAYLGERPVMWIVSDTAKNAIATVRLQQMARPKSGRTVNDDYDPYKVSSAAKNARPTPRVTELSVPIPRKVRPKKS